MFEHLPLIAFQIVFAAAGFAILYRIAGRGFSAGRKADRGSAHGDIFRRKAASTAQS